MLASVGPVIMDGSFVCRENQQVCIDLVFIQVELNSFVAAFPKIYVRLPESRFLSIAGFGLPSFRVILRTP